MDYEVQYNETIRYVDRTLADNADLLEVYRVCIPFKVSTCTSMFQRFWRPWEDNLRDLWVRDMPEICCYRKEDFDFYTEEMWDYDFQVKFAEWYHRKKKAQRTCCLIGIRTQESYHRWQAIHRDRNYHSYKHLKWTHKVTANIFNAYTTGLPRTSGPPTENFTGITTTCMISTIRQEFLLKDNAWLARLSLRLFPA